MAREEVPVSGSGDDLVAAFARWAAEKRVADAARSRARERSLRDQASGSATWVGTLVDLSETAERVRLAAGSLTLFGRVVGVGRDFLVVDQGSGRTSMVATSAVSAVWPETPARPATGDRPPPIDVDFPTALSLLAEDRRPVAATTDAAEVVVGDLIAAGEDVVSVRTPAPARRIVHIRVGSVIVCELR